MEEHVSNQIQCTKHRSFKPDIRKSDHALSSKKKLFFIGFYTILYLSELVVILESKNHLNFFYINAISHNILAGDTISGFSKNVNVLEETRKSFEKGQSYLEDLGVEILTEDEEGRSDFHKKYFDVYNDATNSRFSGELVEIRQSFEKVQSYLEDLGVGTLTEERFDEEGSSDFDKKYFDVHNDATNFLSTFKSIPK